MSFFLFSLLSTNFLYIHRAITINEFLFESFQAIMCNMIFQSYVIHGNYFHYFIRRYDF